MIPGEQRRICVSGSFENVRTLARFTRSACSGLFLDEQIDLIELAVVEAGNNIVEHAYPDTPNKPIELIIDCKIDNFTICIIDTGLSFDPDKVPEPEMNWDDIKDVSLTGRGVFLIKTIMDKVTFSCDNKFNIITMHKKITSLSKPPDTLPFIYCKDVDTGVAELDEFKALKGQMHVVTDLHKELIAKRIPKIDTLELFARSEPALEVGGDYITFHKADDENLWFMICDAMGKGISASFFSILAHMTFQSILFMEPEASPGELLTFSNRIMGRDFDRFAMFMTALVGKIDIANDRLYYSSAGHCPPIIYSEKGGIDLLETHDYMLGVDKVTKYKTYSVPFLEKMKLLAYTDGITDITDANGEMVGVEPLLYACASEFKKSSISKACNSIFGDVLIASGKHLQDDVSMIGLERL